MTLLVFNYSGISDFTKSRIREFIIKKIFFSALIRPNRQSLNCGLSTINQP